MRKAIVPAILLVLVCGSHVALPSTDSENPAKALEEKLNRLILPEEPEVGGDSLAVAVEKLRVASVKADPAESLTGKGVNFVILRGAEIELPKTAAPKLRDVPLAACLRLITAQAGITCRVDSHAVVIGPKLAKRQPFTAADAPAEREKRLLNKLSKTIRPTVNFQDTSFEEAVEFLRITRGCFSPPDDPVPVNIVQNVRHRANLPPITLNFRDIPLMEALRYVAEITGLELSLRHSAVVFSEPGKSPPRPGMQPAKPNDTEGRARKIILPNVEFAEARFPEALESLFIKAAQPELNAAGWGFSHEVGVEQNAIPPVTLSLTDIPFADALEHLATVSGLVLSCEEGKFVFQARP